MRMNCRHHLCAVRRAPWYDAEIAERRGRPDVRLEARVAGMPGPHRSSRPRPPLCHPSYGRPPRSRALLLCRGSSARRRMPPRLDPVRSSCLRAFVAPVRRPARASGRRPVASGQQAGQTPAGCVLPSVCRCVLPRDRKREIGVNCLGQVAVRLALAHRRIRGSGARREVGGRDRQTDRRMDGARLARQCGARRGRRTLDKPHLHTSLRPPASGLGAPALWPGAPGGAAQTPRLRVLGARS